MKVESNYLEGKIDVIGPKVTVQEQHSGLGPEVTDEVLWGPS